MRGLLGSACRGGEVLKGVDVPKSLKWLWAQNTFHPRYHRGVLLPIGFFGSPPQSNRTRSVVLGELFSSIPKPLQKPLQEGFQGQNLLYTQNITKPYNSELSATVGSCHNYVDHGPSLPHKDLSFPKQTGSEPSPGLGTALGPLARYNGFHQLFDLVEILFWRRKYMLNIWNKLKKPLAPAFATDPQSKVLLRLIECFTKNKGRQSKGTFYQGAHVKLSV